MTAKSLSVSGSDDNTSSTCAWITDAAEEEEGEEESSIGERSSPASCPAASEDGSSALRSGDVVDTDRLCCLR